MSSPFLQPPRRKPIVLRHPLQDHLRGQYQSSAPQCRHFLAPCPQIAHPIRGSGARSFRFPAPPATAPLPRDCDFPQQPFFHKASITHRPRARRTTHLPQDHLLFHKGKRGQKLSAAKWSTLGGRSGILRWSRCSTDRRKRSGPLRSLPNPCALD